jgi:hypothetical protein
MGKGSQMGRRWAGTWLCLIPACLCFLLAPAAAPAARPAVVGGTVVTAPSQAPWSVLITSGTTLCSGSIVDAVHVLTAAHCTDGGATPLSDYRVAAGYAGPAPASQAYIQSRGVVGVRVEPNYSLAPDHADVAILTVSPAFDLSGPGVQAIPIVGQNAGPALGATTLSVGWGESANTGAVDYHERALLQTSYRQRDCNSGIPSTLCSRSETGALCPGDSGSGLVSTGGPLVLLGVNDFVDAPAEAPCQVGSLSGATNLASPEIQQWLAGNEAPPQGPATFGLPTVSATEAGRVGGEVICEPPAWTGAPALATEFLVAETAQTLQASSSNRYLIQPGDLGKAIGCVSIASNAGGTTEAGPSGQAVVVQPPLPPVKPPPKRKSTSRRLVRLTAKWRGPRWEVRVKAARLLWGKTARFAWKVPGCASCRKPMRVRLKRSLNVWSPRLGRRAAGTLVVTVPSVTTSRVVYRRSKLRHKLRRPARRHLRR